MQDSLPAGGLRLYREGVEPSGSLRKVSGYISILLSRASPVARIVYADEACQEVFHRAGRPTAGERNERDVVAGQFGTVPRAVLTDERTAAEALRKTRATIEQQPERRRVRPERKVRG